MSISDFMTDMIKNALAVSLLTRIPKAMADRISPIHTIREKSCTIDRIENPPVKNYLQKLHQDYVT